MHEFWYIKQREKRYTRSIIYSQYWDQMTFLRGLSLEYIIICMYTGLHYNTDVKCLWFLHVVFSVTLCVMMACWRHHVLCSERVIFTFHIFVVVVWIVFCILHRQCLCLIILLVFARFIFSPVWFLFSFILHVNVFILSTASVRL